MRSLLTDSAQAWLISYKLILIPFPPESRRKYTEGTLHNPIKYYSVKDLNDWNDKKDSGPSLVNTAVTGEPVRVSCVTSTSLPPHSAKKRIHPTRVLLNVQSAQLHHVLKGESEEARNVCEVRREMSALINHASPRNNFHSHRSARNERF